MFRQLRIEPLEERVLLGVVADPFRSSNLQEYARGYARGRM